MKSYEKPEKKPPRDKTLTFSESRICVKPWATSTGPLAKMARNSGFTRVKFYAHDHLYSPVALIYGYGTYVFERYEYDAYGEPTIWDGSFSTTRQTSNHGNFYLFTGRRVDILDNGSLKIQYNRNRYYDYYTGRWLTHDPLGISPPAGMLNPFSIRRQYRNGTSLYEYVGSNPAFSGDPRGFFSSAAGERCTPCSTAWDKPLMYTWAD
ncbi:MAG: RHS repeat-associated core domain-containing protein [Planctomycetota bacterium]|jgi:RHS repeat-associated protein